MAAADMDILQGGLEGAMAQQELKGVGVNASVEQMGGKGVPQGVETRAVFHADPSSGLIITDNSVIYKDFDF